jgi:hypothetical protein
MKQIIPLFGLILLLSSCIKNNPDPAWIEINEWQLDANSNATSPAGELTESITDAWVYVDNDFVGTFELPCKIPVLYAGTKVIRIYPTILNNGISATKKIYPFLEYEELTIDLVENETVTINPITRYKASTQFWIEDFEAAGTKLEDDPNSVASLELINSGTSIIAQPFNGNRFGRVSLSTSVNSWIGYSVSSAVLNIPQGEVYLEIDYHNTNRVTTGLLAVSPSGTVNNPNIQMNPQDNGAVEWKKIYIDMREIVSASASGSYFQLSFQALLDDDETTGEINIDNIKVLFY